MTSQDSHNPTLDEQLDHRIWNIWRWGWNDAVKDMSKEEADKVFADELLPKWRENYKALIADEVVKELEDYRRQWHTLLRLEAHQDLNERIATIRKREQP